jgi:hypothetical protein
MKRGTREFHVLALRRLFRQNGCTKSRVLHKGVYEILPQICTYFTDLDQIRCKNVDLMLLAFVTLGKLGYFVGLNVGAP